LVCGLEVASLPLLIGVVLDEEVPGQVGVFRHLRIEGWDGVVDVSALVITGFNEKCLVARKGKTGSEGTATYIEN
jgi:hypothetical protein